MGKRGRVEELLAGNSKCGFHLVGEEPDLRGDEPVLRPRRERVEHVEEDEGREGHGVVVEGHLQVAWTCDIHGYLWFVVV